MQFHLREAKATEAPSQPSVRTLLPSHEDKPGLDGLANLQNPKAARSYLRWADRIILSNAVKLL